MLILVLISLLITNCSNIDEMETFDEKTICSEHLETYVYNGEVITLDYVQYSDESVGFNNDTTSVQFKVLMDVLHNRNASILTFTDQEDLVYLFDSADEKEEFLKEVRKDLSGLKSATTWHDLYINCYVNSGFNNLMFDAEDPDDGITPTHYNTGNYDGFANLSYVNGTDFNDKMSSIQVLNYSGMEAEIQLYSDATFGGYDWTIYVRPSSVNGVGDSNQDDGYRDTRIYHLVDFSTRTMYWYGLFNNRRKTWDNQVSSMRWRKIDCVGPCLQY